MDAERESPQPPRGLLGRLFAGRAQPLAARAEAQVVAIASGKGGTGKSFVATNLAIALHRAGRRVVLVDCDFGLANAHLLLGVHPRVSLQHFVEGAVAAPELVHTTASGPSLVAGATGLAAWSELDVPGMRRVAEAIQWVAARHDVVLLDCGAGLAPQTLTTILGSQCAIVVTNPEIAALTDAYALIKCLARQPGCPELHLLVNRVPEVGLGLATFEKMSEVCRRFVGCSIHYLGEVPEDPAVSQRRLGQPPLLVGNPECAASKSILGLAVALDRARGGFAPRPVGGDGVMHRVQRQLRRW